MKYQKTYFQYTRPIILKCNFYFRKLDFFGGRIAIFNIDIMFRLSISSTCKAADFMNLTDKTVLVIGTQQPWLEAVLLTKSPRKIVTLEYGHYLR